MTQDLAVTTIQGVRCYLDEKGTAWLNVEDVARGLGFTQSFSANRKRGEFFDIEFDDACKAIENKGILPERERKNPQAEFIQEGVVNHG